MRTTTGIVRDRSSNDNDQPALSIEALREQASPPCTKRLTPAERAADSLASYELALAMLRHRDDRL
jgi:hypothetical protein